MSAARAEAGALVVEAGMVFLLLLLFLRGTGIGLGGLSGGCIVVRGSGGRGRLTLGLLFRRGVWKMHFMT